PLIYFWGLNGAILATVISEACVTGYQLWVVRKIIKYRQLFLNLPKYLLAGLVMFIPIFWINNTVHTSILSIGAEVLLGMIIYVLMILLLRPTILEKAKKMLAERKAK
ncbi:polysaccharide biosynthesis C-terminal domain-containing protein, partial [Liquorilactobacillus ghanensis]